MNGASSTYHPAKYCQGLSGFIGITIYLYLIWRSTVWGIYVYSITVQWNQNEFNQLKRCYFYVHYPNFLPPRHRLLRWRLLLNFDAQYFQTLR